VNVRVAHRTAEQDERVIQQVAVAVLRVLQLFQEGRQQTDVVSIDLRVVVNSLRRLSMMRSRVEGRGNTALRKNSVAGVSAQLQGRNPCNLRRERQRLKIQHQPD
jgi:hypothetical protein